MHATGGTIIPGKTQFYDPMTEAGYEGLAGYLGEAMRQVFLLLTTHFVNPLLSLSDRVLHQKMVSNQRA